MLKNKKVPKKNPTLNRSQIKYVIYCRKSREESGDWQKQSLLDQLRTCLDYAKQKGINIEHHNDITETYFRDESFQRWTNDCKGTYEQSILERANGLFYIVEQKSAKTPNNRPLRSKLISLVKKWKIQWILSYAPDRHARNLVESGELVQLIDQNYLDVQYTNFTFENNENGRMILGINFVISYNYSDVLSKNVGRWKMGVIERGQADGKHKYGYFINKEKYHEPDPEYFEVWKEAFRRKVYENQTDESIGKFIISSWFKRKYKNKETEFNTKVLYTIWLDPFYYGVLISWNNEIDLRDGASPYYQPLITEEEHKILLDRHLQTNPTSLRAYKTKDEYDELKIIPNKFLQYEGKYGMIFELPNPKRHRDALAKLKISNPDATLKDVVKPHQFHYKLTGMKVNDKQFSISGEELIILISDFFKKHFQLNESNYEKYREYQLNEYDKTIKNINEKRRKLQLQMNHISSLMEEHARNFNKQINPNELQKNVFQRDIQKYQEQIDYLQREIGKLTVGHRNTILELDGFIGGLVKINERYDNEAYVRKRKFTSLFFSNITINAEKVLVFNAKPWLNKVFIQDNQDGRETFERIYDIVKGIDFAVLKPIIQFSYSVNKSFFDQNHNITSSQKVLYGLEEENLIDF